MIRSFSSSTTRYASTRQQSTIKRRNQATLGYKVIGSWDLKSQRLYFQNVIAPKFNIKSLDEWHTLTAKQLRDAGCRSILNRYKSPLMENLLTALYPKQEWKAKNFRRMPLRFWNKKANRLRWFETFAQKNRVMLLEDWYDISWTIGNGSNSRGVMNTYYGNSLVAALTDVYPHVKWLKWRFKIVPRYFWDSHDNQRQGMEGIAQSLNVRLFSDWYNIKTETLSAGAARTIMFRHNNSVSQVLRALYPNFAWNDKYFVSSPRLFLALEQNRRERFDQIAEELNIKQLSDWYTRSFTELYTRGASTILKKYYGFSLRMALKNLYPDFNWEDWRFNKMPRGYWDGEENIKAFLLAAEKKLYVRQPSDWYRVSRGLIGLCGGTGLLNNQYPECLRLIYPEEKWDRKKFSVLAKKSLQRLLHKIVDEALPNFQVF